MLDEIRTGRLLHGDLIPANVMVDPDAPGRGIVGVFDTDRTWWGDPAADWTFTYIDRLAEPDRAAFWTGYGGRLLDGDGAAQRCLFYRVRALGEILLESARLGRADQHDNTYREIHDLAAAIG